MTMYRIEVQVAQNHNTRIWRSFYGPKVRFTRDKAIAKAAKIRRVWKKRRCGRIRIRPI
jgi:ribosome-binding factor A